MPRDSRREIFGQFLIGSYAGSRVGSIFPRRLQWDPPRSSRVPPRNGATASLPPSFSARFSTARRDACIPIARSPRRPSSDFIDLVRDTVTVGRISQGVTERNTERVHRSGSFPLAERSRAASQRAPQRASIQSPNHNNAVVDVWRSSEHGINIGTKYVIPDIAGGHLICSLYIIPR